MKISNKVKYLLLTVIAAVAVSTGVVASDATGSSFDLRVISQTNTKITLGWDAQTNVAAYVFYAKGQRVSHTFDGTVTRVTFSKVNGCTTACYEVDDLRSDGRAGYPVPAPPPPPPTAKITQTIVNGSTIANLNNWRAVYDADNNGTEDDPGSIRFLIDGTEVLTEENAPFGDTFAEAQIQTANGVHTFKVDAVNATGTVLATNTVSATIDAGTPPPPPPPTGFPDASNTGVPDGTNLTAYTGPTTITTAGTVIDSKTIGCITVEAANVTIKNSRVTCSAFYGMRVANTNASASLLFVDSELSCNGANGHGFGERNIVLRRANVHHCENGLTVQDDVTVEDSYIHDLTMANDAHADGMQFEEAANNVRIVHNTIFGMGSNGQFGTSSLIADLTGHSNWLIENNLFGGGAFTVYCAAGRGTNWIIRNNAFTNRFSQAAGRGDNIGYFGHSNQCGDEQQSGNYILETGQPLQLG